MADKYKEGMEEVMVQSDGFPRIAHIQGHVIEQELQKAVGGVRGGGLYQETESDIGDKTKFVMDLRGRCIVYLKRDSGEYIKISLKPKEIPESSLGIKVSEEIQVEDFDTLIDKIRSFKK